MTTTADTRIVDATRAHIPFIAWTQLAAHRSHVPKGMWDFMLGYDDDARTLRHIECMIDTKQMHWGHWSGFKVAEVDAVPAAAMTGFFEHENPIEDVLAAANEANLTMGRTPEEAAAGWERAKSITNMHVERTPGAWVVEYVATHPDYRRRGLVDRLLHEMLDRGRQRGATVANISVFIGNDSAQSAYEKAGFTVKSEGRDAEFESVYGCPGIRMLERAI